MANLEKQNIEEGKIPKGKILNIPRVKTTGIEFIEFLAMEQIEKNVQELFHFRDHFFENHPIEEASQKGDKLHQKLQETLDNIDQIEADVNKDNVKAKANLLYQKGRAMNVLSDHSPEAETLLSKAVKLDPVFVEAWNELGECYWKRGEVDQAQTCFEGALKQESNKVSLRSLSIVMRLKANSSGNTSNEERSKSIESGLSKAREALQLDTTDGISWSVLGNAYLMHFFSISQNPKTLKQAMSAYKQAEKDVIAASSSELHYNKGVALKYEEEYNSALESFQRAFDLDPTWDQPKQQKKSLLNMLHNINNLIELKGKLKNKRFNSLVDSIDSNKSLGPYGGGKYSSSTGKSVELTELKFAELKEGLNEKKVVLGKVICSVHSEETVPFTFCLTDKTGHSLSVNLYNLAPGKGVIIGDSVAIPEPYFTHVAVEDKEKVIEFDLIRVDSPLVLVINGKKAGQEMQAGIQLSTFTKTE